MGSASPVEAAGGMDQWCPLSPAFVAVGIASALEAIVGKLEAFDSWCRLFSYLDHVMFLAPPERADEAYTTVQG